MTLKEKVEEYVDAGGKFDNWVDIMCTLEGRAGPQEQLFGFGKKFHEQQNHHVKTYKTWLYERAQELWAEYMKELNDEEYFNKQCETGEFEG